MTATSTTATTGSTSAETMTVRIRDHAKESWGSGPTTPHVRTVTISAFCPICGGRRGEPRNSNERDDGAYYSVDVWDNPCGHVDYYHCVAAEADKLATKSGSERVV